MTLVRQGLEDLQSGRDTIPARLVSIARPRLRRAGLWPAATPTPAETTELGLYRRLRGESGDAYSRYNALIRELVSFECGLNHRLRQAQSKIDQAGSGEQRAARTTGPHDNGTTDQWLGDIAPFAGCLAQCGSLALVGSLC